jgi:hypothetical protein
MPAAKRPRFRPRMRQTAFHSMARKGLIKSTPHPSESLTLRVATARQLDRGHGRNLPVGHAHRATQLFPQSHYEDPSDLFFHRNAVVRGANPQPR